jgi:hypothetical protein
MKFTGELSNTTFDFRSGCTKIELLLRTNEVDSILKLNGSKLNVELKKKGKEKTTSANSYLWVLCDEIALELSKDGTIVTKEQVYQDGITAVGIFQDIDIREEAYETFERIWEDKENHIGYITEIVSAQNGELTIRCYYGSSCYNSIEMSRLINYIKELAENFGIPTKSKAEIDSLLKEIDK